MSDPRTTPTDGDPPAPILRAHQRPIGCGFALERPEQYVDRPELVMAPTIKRSAAFRDWLANRYSDREKRLDVRAVHSGATSHDCESAA